MTLEELSDRWNFTIDQVVTEVLSGNLTVWCWAKSCDPETSKNESRILVPVPASRIQDSYDLTPNLSIEDRKVGFSPVDKIETSDLPFELSIENNEGVRLRETRLLDLLVKIEDIERSEKATQNISGKYDNTDELTLDTNGMFVLYQGNRYDFTPGQIQFLSILAKRKISFLSNEVPSASLNGNQAIAAAKKIDPENSNLITSKKVSDLFQKKHQEALKSITVDNQDRPKGIYQLRGKSIKVL